MRSRSLPLVTVAAQYREHESQFWKDHLTGKRDSDNDLGCWWHWAVAIVNSKLHLSCVSMSNVSRKYFVVWPWGVGGGWVRDYFRYSLSLSLSLSLYLSPSLSLYLPPFLSLSISLSLPSYSSRTVTRILTADRWHGSDTSLVLIEGYMTRVI